MKIRKTLLGLIAVVFLGSTLSGCVIVPVPFGFGHGHGGYDHYRR